MPRRSEAGLTEPFEQRNREIGAILAQARQRESYTVTECAAVALTTRRRYTMIERGEASVSAVELEALMRFLQVPANLIWAEFVPPTQPRQVVVQAQPGERIQLVVEVQR
jgi:transcriptional regulator with XRE-family HTH domain